jgi:hypothetical protein
MTRLLHAFGFTATPIPSSLFMLFKLLIAWPVVFLVTVIALCLPMKAWEFS